MRKFSRIIATALTVCTLASVSSLSADAATDYVRNGDGYLVYTATTNGNYNPTRKKLDALGFKKTKYTTGGVTVTKTESVSASASVTLSAQYGPALWKVGGSVSVSATQTKTVSAGTVVNVAQNAPDGIYYAYVCLPRKKVDFKVQSCSLNHVSWSTLYTKTSVSAPQKNAAYLEVAKA